MRGVTIHRLAVIEEQRGSLSAAEFSRDVPFAALRYFIVYNVPGREVRGEHAHRVCRQFLVAIRGSLYVAVDDGQNRAEILLDSPATGVHIPAMVWGAQYRYSRDACLLVFASERYDPRDYIRDYQEFLAIKRGSGAVEPPGWRPG